MEGLGPENPPAYEQESVTLPSFNSQTFLPPPSPVSLPDLKSLRLPASRPNPLPLTPSQWHSSYSQPPHSAGFPPPSLPPPSPMDTESVMSEGRRRAPSIMSIDDPDAREAAETLSVLRNIDFYRSQKEKDIASISPLTRAEEKAPILPSPQVSDDDTEPLLSLITSSHPWLGGTLKTSIYAYESTMSFTPQLVQSFVQNQIATVGSLSRVTGVESRVRQYFGETPERKSTRAKRHRESSPEMEDVEKGLTMSPPSRHRSRAGSQVSFAETLPAYDDNKAPEYEQTQSSSSSSQRWLVTTSGLGVALSDKSLRSLRYCLGFLKLSTNRLGGIMAALSKLIAEYERNAYGFHQGNQANYLNAEQEVASQEIAEHIKKLGSDIMTTLQSVTDQVSKYTGGTLPENASALVRRQLMSVPQRWRIAQETPPSNEQVANVEALQTGQKLLVFAEQGCDMIAQVTIVLSGTVDSAEKWIDSMGKRRQSVAMSIDSQGSDRTIIDNH